LPRRRILAKEVFEDERRRQRVHRMPAPLRRAALSPCSFSGPRSEPLVHQAHRQTQFLVQPPGEPRRLFRHFAHRAVEVQRPAHHDGAHFVPPDNLPQAAEVVAPVRAHQRGQRARGQAQLVGERQAQPALAVIYRQQATAFCGSTGGNRSTRGGSHSPLLYRVAARAAGQAVESAIHTRGSSRCDD
jgi:hypothetical protein